MTRRSCPKCDSEVFEEIGAVETVKSAYVDYVCKDCDHHETVEAYP